MEAEAPSLATKPHGRVRGMSRTARAACVAAVTALAALLYASILDKTYPVSDWLVWRMAALWIDGAGLSLACLSFGYLITVRVLRTRGPLLEVLVTSAAVGLVGFTMGMYLGGFLGLYRPWFGCTLPAVMVASGARPLYEDARRLLAQKRGSHRGHASLLTTVILSAARAWGVVLIAFVYLEAMTPDAINFDAAWSHIPIAQDYARAGRIIPFVGDYTRNFPHLASLVHTWAFLLPGLSPPLRWMLVLHDELFFFLWTLAGVAAVAEWMLSRRIRGAWAAFFLFPAIFVYDGNLGGAADHYLAFFAPPLFLAAVRAAPGRDPRRFILWGVVAAGALLTKYQAVYILCGTLAVYVACVLGRVVARRDSVRRAVVRATKGLGIAAVAGAVLVSPHYVRSWVFYGNPFYPFAQRVFASRPTTPHAAFLFEYLFKDWSWRPHGSFFENMCEAARLCFTFSFEPHYSFTNDVPSFGSLFTLTLPLLLFIRARRRLWLGALSALVSLFAWG